MAFENFAKKSPSEISKAFKKEKTEGIVL